MAEEKEEWKPDEEDALAKDLENESPELSELVEIIDPNDNSEPEPESKPEKEDDPEDDAISNRMQKRIDQLTARRHEAERREEAKDQQLQQLQERLNSLESTQEKQNVQSFQEKYDQVKRALMAAAEEGDTEKQVSLTEQMADMRATARMNEFANSQITAKQNVQQQAETSQQNQAPEAAYAWWNRNSWFNTPENSTATAFARAVDVQLEAEGFDKNSPDYYKELDNRCQDKFPELYTKTVNAKSKPPTSPSGGKKRVSKQSSKDGRIQLTRDQLSMARELGLTTEAQLKAYAKEIQELN
jgi:hypothetical protein|tara:strand:+ start:336 stop:1235 length:900 start_codon:yes stop_codon:yes gene_type:complete